MNVVLIAIGCVLMALGMVMLANRSGYLYFVVDLAQFSFLPAWSPCSPFGFTGQFPDRAHVA